MNGGGKLETFADLYDLFLQQVVTLRLRDNTTKLYGQTVKEFGARADSEGLEPHTFPFQNVLSYVGGLKREDGELSAGCRGLRKYFSSSPRSGKLPATYAA